MPKPSTYPTLYDSVKQINITDLKKLGYFKPDSICTGVLSWSVNGEPSGSITIKANTVLYPWTIRLDYNYGNEPRSYKIKIVSVPSNLGKGFIHYFICPKTHKRARKLYLVDGYFLHREAFKKCMYETQTHSKKFRQYKNFLGGDSLYEKLYQKHFKASYNGKPTKKYLKLMERIEKAESISSHEIQRFMLS